MVLDGKYFFSSSGLTCLDIGTGTIGTSTECRSSLSELKKFKPDVQFVQEVVYSTFPKGCYLRSNGVFWNNHQTGSRYWADDGRQICLGPGM